MSPDREEDFQEVCTWNVGQCSKRESVDVDDWFLCGHEFELLSMHGSAIEAFGMHLDFRGA